MVVASWYGEVDTSVRAEVRLAACARACGVRKRGFGYVRASKDEQG